MTKYSHYNASGQCQIIRPYLGGKEKYSFKPLFGQVARTVDGDVFQSVDWLQLSHLTCLLTLHAVGIVIGDTMDVISTLWNVGSLCYNFCLIIILCHVWLVMAALYIWQRWYDHNITHFQHSSTSSIPPLCPLVNTYLTFNYTTITQRGLIIIPDAHLSLSRGFPFRSLNSRS